MRGVLDWIAEFNLVRQVPTFNWRRVAAHSLVVGAIVLSQAAVASAEDRRSKRNDEHAVTFAKSLQACRIQQPGRLNKRMALPATHPGVANCLKQHGWQTDGNPAPPAD